MTWRITWLLMVLLVGTLLAPLGAQAPTVTEELILPGPLLGVANALAPHPDGGVLVVGYGDPTDTGRSTAVLVRLTEGGDTLWTRAIGDAVALFGWDVVVGQDGGSFVVGFTEPPPPEQEQILVLRLDPTGTPIWRRTLGGAGRDRAWSAVGDGAGGIVLAAESQGGPGPERDALLMRIDGAGEIVWSTRIEAEGDQRIYELARLPNGGVVAVGTSQAPGRGERDLHLVTVDNHGVVAWTRTFGGEGDDVGHGVFLVGERIVVVGYASQAPDRRDPTPHLLSYTLDGALTRHVQLPGPRPTRIMTGVARGEGGLALVGFTYGDGPMEMVVLETTGEGELEQRIALPRPGSARGVSIHPLPGGGYRVVGTVGMTPEAPGQFAVLRVAS
jgi:outer membrane protein assembly factor BamB